MNFHSRRHAKWTSFQEVILWRKRRAELKCLLKSVPLGSRPPAHQDLNWRNISSTTVRGINEMSERLCSSPLAHTRRFDNSGHFVRRSLQQIADDLAIRVAAGTLTGLRSFAPALNVTLYILSR